MSHGSCGKLVSHLLGPPLRAGSFLTACLERELCSMVVGIEHDVMEADNNASRKRDRERNVMERKDSDSLDE